MVSLALTKVRVVAALTIRSAILTIYSNKKTRFNTQTNMAIHKKYECMKKCKLTQNDLQ